MRRASEIVNKLKIDFVDPSNFASTSYNCVCDNGTVHSGLGVDYTVIPVTSTDRR